MRTNGTIQYEVVIGGGVNQYGEPIPAEQGWSDPVECAITTVSDSRLGKYEDGEFRQASFMVGIEGELSAYTAIKRVKLVRYGEQLGEYRIISVSPLPSVGRTSILV